MASRPPAYQFYPEIWDSHTRRLSDSGYRVYHQILNWMWTHADDFASIPADPGDLANVLGEPCERIAQALLEIQNPHMPLLVEHDGKLISKRLKEQYREMKTRSDKAKKSAKARWDNKKQTDANASPEHDPSNANAMPFISISTSTSNVKEPSNQQPTGQQEQGAKEKLKSFDPPVQELAKRLAKLLAERYAVAVSNEKITRFASSIAWLAYDSEITLERQDTALSWFEGMEPSQFTPEIMSGFDWANKFLKVESAMKTGETDMTRALREAEGVSDAS